MIISDSTTDKDFGFNPSAKNIAICLITSIIGNDYNSSLKHGSNVDIINFEIRCTDIAASILEVINPYLQSFKLRLTMDTYRLKKACKFGETYSDLVPRHVDYYSTGDLNGRDK